MPIRSINRVTDRGFPVVRNKEGEIIYITPGTAREMIAMPDDPTSNELLKGLARAKHARRKRPRPRLSGSERRRWRQIFNLFN